MPPRAFCSSVTRHALGRELERGGDVVADPAPRAPRRRRPRCGTHQVELQRLRLEAERVGLARDRDAVEVGLAGDRADGGQLVARQLDLRDARVRRRSRARRSGRCPGGRARRNRCPARSSPRGHSSPGPAPVGRAETVYDGPREARARRDGRRSLGVRSRARRRRRRSRTRAEGTKLAQASLLRIGDFGSGWTSEAATGASTGPELRVHRLHAQAERHDRDRHGQLADVQGERRRADRRAADERLRERQGGREAVAAGGQAEARRLRRAVAPGARQPRRHASRSPARAAIAIRALGDGVAGYRVVATLTASRA